MENTGTCGRASVTASSCMSSWRPPRVTWHTCRDINRTTEALEDQLQKSTRNREVLELVKYQKSLTYFATALRSNEVMMERVQRMKLFNQYEEDADLLEDVITENQQAIQMTGIATEILSGMMDAFASIISNNLNGVMKALAALTIVAQHADHRVLLIWNERETCPVGITPWLS